MRVDTLPCGVTVMVCFDLLGSCHIARGAGSDLGDTVRRRGRRDLRELLVRSTALSW